LADLQTENNYFHTLTHGISWKTVRLTLIVFGFLLIPQLSHASGIAGNRYFPVTLAVEHPFVCDELSFVVNHIEERDQGTNEISLTYSKRITPHLGIELRDAYRPPFRKRL
jgi:hypothetical protein